MSEIINSAYETYPVTFWNQIESFLQKNSTKSPLHAAFDADGTLWDMDLGENFFQTTIDNQWVDLPEDPWNYYRENKARHPHDAYLWLAQIYKGRKLQQIEDWAEASLIKIPEVPIFPEQKKLIELLHQHNVKVWVITASVKWAVVPGAKILGIPAENVIGIETQIENGILTEIAKGEITHKEGKAKAFLNATKNQKPFLAAGNTMSDYQLIDLATDFKLAICSARPDDRIFKTEQELQNTAEKLGWIKHKFV